MIRSPVFAFVVFVAVLLTATPSLGADASMPLPFTRPLMYSASSPILAGSDVLIANNLIGRCIKSRFPYATSNEFDETASNNVMACQRLFYRPPTGTFDADIAGLVLDQFSYDGFTDHTPTVPAPFKYKVYVPVFANRSIETLAFLFGPNGTVLHEFIARTHGQDNDATGETLNQFTSNGVTPTGLMTFDLNSPEPDPGSYGPYPVNRAVQGLAGNAKFLISNIRDGILLHTGNWTFPPMPNSHGCIHAHPEDIKAIWQKLVAIGVEVRPNPQTSQAYPYDPQGLLAVEQIDGPDPVPTLNMKLKINRHN